jgi:hypothetical protein
MNDKARIQIVAFTQNTRLSSIIIRLRLEDCLATQYRKARHRVPRIVQAVM